MVGGGTAGITISNNLQKYFNVVVIEKSTYKYYPLRYRIPLLIGLLFRNRATPYISNREISVIGGRHIPFFESNVLGGASIINGCVHMLGSKLKWNRVLKKFDANYDDVLESSERVYSSDSGQESRISLNSPGQTLIDKVFVKTLNLLGVPAGDMNFANEENCGPIYVTAKKYFRSSVISLLGGCSFKTYMGEKVEKLLFDDDGKVTGVRTDKRSLEANYVILSAGVIGTCDFLLRVKDDHEGVLKDLVVGDDIQDHTNVRVNVIANKKIDSLNEISQSFYKRFWMLFRHFMGKPTLLLGTGATSAAHLDLDQDGEIDTRIQIVQFTETGRHGSDGKFFDQEPGFSISITAISPESRGKITLDGSSNMVDPQFLSSKKDIDLLKRALIYCFKLLDSKPISDHILRIEGEDMIKEDPEKYIVSTFFSGHHLSGGAQNAINGNFQVHNTKGLYVCDASVFNEYVASNIHSSVVLLADIFSKKFIAENINT